jgi:hypothetical protein
VGAAIETERFERVDYDRFTERLVHSLAALAVVTENRTSRPALLSRLPFGTHVYV